MAKRNTIIVKDTTIRTLSKDGIDYICITDIAKQRNPIDPNGVIANWMRNRNTIEYLGLWETLYNPNFNPLEFEGFRRNAGLNAFTLSPSQWITATNAIGLISQAGRYGGTYAISDIAFKFANWVSVEFELYLVKEFQRLKPKSSKPSAGVLNENSPRLIIISTPMLSVPTLSPTRWMPTTARSSMQRKPMC